MTSNSVISRALVCGGIAALAATGAGLPVSLALTRASLKAVAKPIEAIANKHNHINLFTPEEESSENPNANGRKVNLTA